MKLLIWLIYFLPSLLEKRLRNISYSHGTYLGFALEYVNNLLILVIIKPKKLWSE